MKHYEKPNAVLVALNIADVIMASEQLTEGENVELITLTTFDWLA